jgi:acyl carrier protein
MSQARHVGKIVLRAPSTGKELTPEGFVLVTGGLGTLGQLITAWLKRQGVKSIHLVGRSSIAGAQQGDVICSPGESAVVVSKADISSAEDLVALLLPGLQHLQGIVHASGALADATVANQTLAGIRGVLAPKVVPAESWQTLVSKQPAAMQVLFSSVAALLGAPGQLNYSAANTLLDGMASATQRRGMVAMSVQWGAWAGGGMASEETAARVERMGMAMIEPRAGIAALHGLLAGKAAAPATVGANPFTWPRFLQRLRSPTQLFENFIIEGAASQANRPATLVAAGQAAQSLTSTGRVSAEAVSVQVAAAVAGVLGGAVATTASLMESGLDSLGAVELRNSLSKEFGMELPATLTFDYPSTAAISTFIVEALGPAEEVVSALEGEVIVGDAAAGQAALAITGVSTR